MTALASSAFRLALRGLRVFPLATGRKIPLAGSHGSLDATNDCDVIRALWKRNPRCNIGIATGSRSALWALDIDPRHGGDQTLAQLEAERGPLPVTIEVSTPSGGRHLYWQWPESGEIRTSTSRIGPGIDVRGEGGSITLPPSVLADGRRYVWVQNGVRAFAEAPEWLIALALPPPPPPRPDPKPLTGDVSLYVAAAVTDELRRLEQAVDGQRNHTLNRPVRRHRRRSRRLGARAA